MARSKTLVTWVPIITSLLDVDWYKLTMWQFVLHRYPQLNVRYALTNRTKRVRLTEHIDIAALRAQLDHARSLRFTAKEIEYLRGRKRSAPAGPLFQEDFLKFLTTYQLPPYTLSQGADGQFQLEFPGSWIQTILWETIALAIVNELYYRSLLDPMSQLERIAVFEEGSKRLAGKIEMLRVQPKVRITEFGTRRRFSREHQRRTVETFAERSPHQIVGTSNAYLAMDLGLTPIGTHAHELFMALSGLMHDSDEQILASHNKVLQDWWNEYGEDLSIALTDTYGSEFFFRDMTYKQACLWKGLRQDSGIPFQFADRAIAFYMHHGINPQGKIIVFSDGLDAQTILKLSDHCGNRIQPAFGWGTNLTNDLGISALSLVVKLVESNGHGTVKLSDNLEKATGRPEDIQRFARIFGYSSRFAEECRY